MMQDLISRQSAIERLKKHRKVFCKNHMEFTILSDKDKARVDEIDNAIATLVNLPSAQPERLTGHWIRVGDGYTDYFKCSECGELSDYEENFCCECGSDMRGKQDEQEIIKSEFEQKCWIPPKGDEAAKRLNDLIFDINPAEICSQIESDNLRNWCEIVQTEMKMAFVQLPCWAERLEE